jgi:hypothetical protein
MEPYWYAYEEHVKRDKSWICVTAGWRESEGLWKRDDRQRNFVWIAKTAEETKNVGFVETNVRGENLVYY